MDTSCPPLDCNTLPMDAKHNLVSFELFCTDFILKQLFRHVTYSHDKSTLLTFVIDNNGKLCRLFGALEGQITFFLELDSGIKYTEATAVETVLKLQFHGFCRPTAIDELEFLAFACVDDMCNLYKRLCHQCGTIQPPRRFLKQCKICKQMGKEKEGFYCSPKCQLLNWAKHKVKHNI